MPSGDENTDVQDTPEFRKALAEAIENSEQTQGLRASKAAILAEKKALEKKLKAYEGIDVDEHKALSEAASRAEEERAKAAGDFESLKKRMQDAHAAELKKYEAKVGSLTTALEAELIDSKALAAIGKHTPNVDLLLPHVRSSLAVVEENGKFRAVVKDANGEERIMADPANPGAFVPMTIEQHVLSLKSQYPAAFPASGGNGSGTDASHISDTGGVTTVAGGDNAAFLANLENIAAGKTIVV